MVQNITTITIIIIRNNNNNNVISIEILGVMSEETKLLRKCKQILSVFIAHMVEIINVQTYLMQRP